MFISYAQNFEDVMLWRALRHVDKGLYVDIGAQDPVIDSVSLSFYQRGWRGIHVEPTPAYAQALRDARTDETVVQAAIGDSGALIPFFEIPGTGISTGNPEIARRHEGSGFATRRLEIPCIPLAALLDGQAGRDIHWMKVDVEGMEESVLRSWAPSAVRPWIVVVESTLPLTQSLSHEHWEPVILELGYTFAYFDGLNRYYVSREHDELLKAFESPPSVFDQFSFAGTASHFFCTSLNETVARSKDEIGRLEALKVDLDDKLLRATTDEATTRIKLNELDGSLAELVAKDAQLAQALDEAKEETLALLRQLTAKSEAHDARMSEAWEELDRLRRDIVGRQTLLEETQAQLQAERQSSLVRLADQRQAFDDSFRAAAEREGELARLRAESEARLSDLSERLQNSLSRLDEAERSRDQLVAAASEAGRNLFARVKALQQEQLKRELSVATQLQSLQVQHEGILATAEERHRAAADRASSLESELRLQLERSRGDHRDLEATLQQTRLEVDAIRSSWTWRIGAPLRILGRALGDPASERTAHASDRDDASHGGEARFPVSAVSTGPRTPLVRPVIHTLAQSYMTVPTPMSIDELLALHDESFVRMAYVTLLGRPPDNEGHDFYVQRVRSGVSKLVIVKEMALSDEGKKKKVKLAGLDEAVRNWRAAPPRFLDRVVHRLVGHSLEPAEAASRRLENALYRLNGEQQARLTGLESGLSSLRDAVGNTERLLESNGQALEKLRALQRTTRLLPPGLPRAAEGVAAGSSKASDFDAAPRPPEPRPPRRIFMYVDHTISCPTNTGMQRVTRRLGASLIRRGEKVTFVKWNAEHHRFAWIDRDELAFLGQWNGPSLSPAEVEAYPDEHGDARLVDAGNPNALSWLLVPEVTHITPQIEPMTLNVIGEGRRLGMFIAFVFYDATPLRRPEMQAMSVLHARYMQQLLLVDLIIPISAGAASDLCGFLRHDQSADRGPTPHIETLLLPGESQLATRSADEAVPTPALSFILSVGSIVPHKNQLALAMSFENYCRRHPQTRWQLRFAGSIHPDLHDDLVRACEREPRIVYLGEVDDGVLVSLYRQCSFTAFPSLMEGFGLPILESLWFGKPCVCASFGAMGEVAAGGGCLTTDTRSVEAMEKAIGTLIESPERLSALSSQAKARHIDTWSDYAATLGSKLNRIASPVSRLGVVYYLIDHTAGFEGNTGIQRVTRALARSLLEIGVRLVPVLWWAELQVLKPASPEHLQHLERWNGPKAQLWSTWKPIETVSSGDWLIVPELTHLQSEQIRGFAKRVGLPCSWVFYDAIPWKMRQLYSPQAVQAHADYMLAMRDVEKVLAISTFSRNDLVDFLSAQQVRCGDLESHVVACSLPGEFLESPRVVTLPPSCAGRPVRILCVGTVEPRKNHLGLLAAFKVARQMTPDIELVIAGGALFEDLAREVQAEVDSIPGIRWIRKVDDRGLQALYAACDFTVYPSLEEGFGLPILESLWNARPCVCAAFGAMLEVSEGGGCLLVDVADTVPFAETIALLASDAGLRGQLAREATEREFRTWRDYALAVADELASERQALVQIGNAKDCLSAKEVEQDMVNLERRPLLSLCISTYNRAGWLDVSLRNMTRLLPRPLADVEILVCDNTSTDTTPDVVKPYLSRSDFRYVRNRENVGMLGNLKVTAQSASGKFVWILGDDDLVMDGTIERVLEIIRAHPKTALIYTNYAFTRIDEAEKVTDIVQFLRDAEPITTPSPDHFGTVREMCARSENFFTAIYCLVFRRDHAIRAYSQDTSGRPFSTMLTSIPTTYHVIRHMMDEPAFWIGKPTVVVNMNVSWLRYASLWILERLPEAFDLAESRGGDPVAIDVWRLRLIASVVHRFREIFTADPAGNSSYVSIRRLVNRMKHLHEFRAVAPTLEAIYEEARRNRHPLAALPTERVFAATH